MTIRGTIFIRFASNAPFSRVKRILDLLVSGVTVLMVPGKEKDWDVTLQVPWEAGSLEGITSHVKNLVVDIEQIVRDHQIDFVPNNAPTPAPSPNPDALIVKGVVIAAEADGGPLGGTHINIEKPSSRYPWRLHLSEGALSGRPAVWSLPLAGVDQSTAGSLLGTPVRITIERDPDAKF